MAQEMVAKSKTLKAFRVLLGVKSWNLDIANFWCWNAGLGYNTCSTELGQTTCTTLCSRSWCGTTRRLATTSCLCTLLVSTPRSLWLEAFERLYYSCTTALSFAGQATKRMEARTAAQ